MPMIPLDLRNGSVMLAEPSKRIAPTPAETVAYLDAAGTFTYEIKWDGVRCLLIVEDDQIKLVGRKGRDETVRYPELVKNLAGLPNGTVLDGELLVFDGGTPVFNLIQRRNSQSNPAKIAALAEEIPATFMAFDCLMVNYVDMRNSSLEARRMMLSNTVTRLSDPTLQQTPVSADGAAMWAFVQEHKIEGLIAKATGSKYRSRRDDAWLKIKDTKRLTAILLDYEPGEDDSKRRGMVGALKLYLLDENGKPVEIGKCGTGFSDVEATELRVKLDAYATAVAASPTDPPAPLLGEIEYQEVTKDMRLRFPSWRGLRFDIDMTDCTTAQIGV